MHRLPGGCRVSRARRTDPGQVALVGIARALAGTAPPCAAAPEQWFSYSPDDQRDAARACAGCPARTPCEALASVVRPTAGVWAGELHDPSAERRADRRRRVDLTQTSTTDGEDHHP